MTSQISLFCGEEPLKINKKIRLIELFAGIGSQAKALKNIGADFEHYRICEFDKYAVASYNAIHGTDFPVSDITKWHAADLGIIEKDKYEYIMSYSFPCQSLSISGKQEGMAKGSGTRSGLLWEVERILEECDGNLPQVLLMENVDAILFEKNRKHFFQWCNRLEEFGYKNYYEVLNARDYGIPQNRNRCFMESVLGDYYYEFPKPIKLELCVKDLLESEVAEKYYISNERVKELLSRECDGRKGSLPDSNEPMISKALGSREHRYGGWSETCFALEARDYKDPKVAYIPNINPEHEVINMGKTICEERTDEGLRFFKDGCIGAIRTIDGGGDKRVIEPQLNQVAQMYDNESNPQAGRIYDIDGISPAMDSCQGGNRMPKFAVKGELNCYNQYRPDGAQTPLNDRVYDSEGIGLSVTTSPFIMPSYLDNYRIRKLMPIECFSLMGFAREDFFKVKKAGISDSQCYKQAGNSIVVDVLEAIFRNMNIKGVKRWQE
jgi:DNA-cytosine methyltransferase